MSPRFDLVEAGDLARPHAIERHGKESGTDRAGDQRAGEGAGPSVVGPVLPGRGFNGFKALRRIFRAIAICPGGGRKPSAFTLRSDARRCAARQAQ